MLMLNKDQIQVYRSVNHRDIIQQLIDHMYLMMYHQLLLDIDNHLLKQEFLNR